MRTGTERVTPEEIEGYHLTMGLLGTEDRKCGTPLGEVVTRSTTRTLSSVVLVRTRVRTCSVINRTGEDEGEKTTRENLRTKIRNSSGLVYLSGAYP